MPMVAYSRELVMDEVADLSLIYHHRHLRVVARLCTLLVHTLTITR